MAVSIFAAAQNIDQKTMTCSLETLKSMASGPLHQVYLPDGVHEPDQ